MCVCVCVSVSVSAHACMCSSVCLVYMYMYWSDQWDHTPHTHTHTHVSFLFPPALCTPWPSRLPDLPLKIETRNYIFPGQTIKHMGARKVVLKVSSVYTPLLRSYALKINDYFLWVLMFDIKYLQIGPKTWNFVLANISFVHYRTLEFVNSVPFLCTNHKL